MIRIATIIDQLSRVYRQTAGATFQPESDTTHGMMAALVAYDIATRIPSQLNEINEARVLMFALVHDLHEARCGDTDAFRITADERAAKRAREAAAIKSLIAEMPQSTAWAVCAFAQEDCVEWAIAHWADKLCPLYMGAVNKGARLYERGETPETLTEYLAAQARQLCAETRAFLNADQRAFMMGLWSSATAALVETLKERAALEELEALKLFLDSPSGRRPLWSHIKPHQEPPEPLARLRAPLALRKEYYPGKK